MKDKAMILPGLSGLSVRNNLIGNDDNDWKGKITIEITIAALRT